MLQLKVNKIVTIKTKFNFISLQDIVRDCLGLGDLTSKWLDLRGNHDTYEVISQGSEVGFVIFVQEVIV